MSLFRPLLCGIFILITFAAASFAQVAPAKIALINTDSFYDEKTGIAKLVVANKQLDSEFALRIKELQDGGTKLRSIAQELETLRKLPSAQFNQTVYNTKQEEGERLDRDLKYQKTALEDAISKRRKILITPISADIGSAVTEFGKKNGFGAILDVSKLGESGVLLFFQESGDVTKDFILFYNARKGRLRHRSKMSDIFDLTKRPDAELFFSRGDKNDPRLGEIVCSEPTDYESAAIVILGCPQDEGVLRNNGRAGAAAAPEAIREQFYKLTPFNIKKKIFDLGNIVIGGTLEETHETQFNVVAQLLRDGKRVIVLGGGNDISYPDGAAMAEVFGSEQWIGVNIDSHLDVRIAEQRNSGTPYRQLLEEKHLLPTYFYEVGYQTHFCSPVYYEYIRDLGVHRISLEMLRSRAEADLEIREQVRQKFINHSSSLNTFFGFDLDVVRSADAPGTSNPSPLGLRAGEFITLVKYAASLANTRIIEFSEVNPTYDVDNRTTKLVAIGMHRFCSGVI